MPGSPVRVGVAGLGTFGTRHVDAVAESPGAQLVALAHPHEVVLNSIGDRLGVRARYHSLAEMIAASDIECVVLATPGRTHSGQVHEVLAAGMHCLVEKPLALSFTEARSAQQAAKAVGRVLQVGHILRFDARYGQLRARAAEGDLGEIRVIRTRRYFPAAANGHPPPLPVPFDAMVHDLDQILWITNARCRSVHAIGLASAAGDDLDFIGAAMTMTDGTRVFLEAGLVPTQVDELSSPQIDARIEIIGSRGRTALRVVDECSAAVDLSLRAQIAHFLRQVRGFATTGPTSLEDAVEGIRIAEMISAMSTPIG